jgi:hypothetical protein
MKIENNTFLLKTLIAATICYLGILSPGRAGTYTWNGTGNDWFQDANWDGDTGYPGDGDTATIGSGTLTLTNQTGYLSSLTVTGGTVTFTNWATCLRATDIVISGGTLTLPPAFVDAAMSNRVYIICSNLTFGADATIDTYGKGFKGGVATTDDGNGPGAGQITGTGTHYGGGGGHGGAGADGSSGLGGPIYGVTNAPLNPGSGGGGASAGDGGGAVRIEASGTVAMDGTVNASGDNGWYGGGGSGGGIFISCHAFQGATSGALRADGGNATANANSAGGGGGRISVAVGMTETDVQKLIDEQPVANLFINSSHPQFLGQTSVTNGARIDSLGNPVNRPGEPGTLRFLQVILADTYMLTVNGAPGTYGLPDPYPYGVNVNIPADAVVTNTVASLVDEGAGVGRRCLGWSVTNALGASLGSGTDNQAIFTLTTNAVLTFSWTNMYQVTVTSAVPAQGSVNASSVEGWYTNGVAVTGITATAEAGYEFSYWTGVGVPEGHETDNPLSVSMTEPHFLTANFAVPGGETKTWNGTGNWTETGNWTPVGIPGTEDDAYIASGTVTVSEPHLTGSLTVSNGTSVIFTNWAAKITAANAVTIAGTVTLPPPFYDDAMSNRIYFACGDFTLAAGGVLDADAHGFRGGTYQDEDGYGPGAGQITGAGTHYGGGGGHGGAGADGSSGLGGPIYGVTNAPLNPGSGGGGHTSGHGGGAVRIEASGTVTIDGAVNASGNNGWYGGGGSGGAIFINCKTFQGAASGELRADGGNATASANSAGGGGGRIAVAIGMTQTDVQKLIDEEPVADLYIASAHPTFLGQASVTNGAYVDALGNPAGRPGEPGTLRFLQVLSGYTLVVAGEPDTYGVPSPYPYGVNLNVDADAVVTNTVASFIDEGDGLGRGCVGWTVTNALGATTTNGTDNQAVFTMSTNLFLTYRWTNMCQLTVTSALPAQGSVNAATVEGWYTNGVDLTGITATAAGGYVFSYWTGIGVPEGHDTDNPLSVSMTEPHFLTANFAVPGGETKTWNGTGNWTETGNWTPVGIPGAEDDAYIASGTVTVSEPHRTGSLTISNGTTLVFSNWNVRISASADVTVEGEVTLPTDFAENEMSNRVYFACDDFTLSSNGIIDAAAKGFSGSPAVGLNGQGPGKGTCTAYYGGGAGHGGAGADGSDAVGTGGSIYDVTNAPIAPGSGGGGNGGGHGGGVVRIAANNTVTIDGTIDANGGNHSVHGGGGSGGSIFISCRTFKGKTSGDIHANGGNGLWNSSGSSGGGAGGGRIAVAIGMNASDLERLSQDLTLLGMSVSETHPPYAGNLSVTNGWSGDVGRPGEPGTIRIMVAPIRGSLLILK